MGTVSTSAGFCAPPSREAVTFLSPRPTRVTMACTLTSIGWEIMSPVALVPSMAARLVEFRLGGESVSVESRVRATLKAASEDNPRRRC